MMLRRRVKGPCPRHGLLAALVLCLPDPALAHETGSAFSLMEKMVLIWLACTAAFLMVLLAKTRPEYLMAGFLFLLAMLWILTTITNISNDAAHSAPVEPLPAATAPGAAE